jgi:DNA-binding HxlR family transcriptional regulator
MCYLKVKYMPERRSYDQYCGVARALDVVGERWTLLVVRDLLLGPRRYSDLLHDLPGITTNLLAKRLRDLEDVGLVEKRATGAGGEGYALTERGAALEPVIMELGRWAGPLMATGPRRGDHLSLGRALLSSKRRYRGGLTCVVDVRADDGERYELAFEPSRLHVERRPAVRPDVVVSGSAAALRRAFASPDPRDAAAAIATLRTEGDGRAWRSVLASMDRTPPAARAS